VATALLLFLSAGAEQQVSWYNPFFFRVPARTLVGCSAEGIIELIVSSSFEKLK